MLIKTRNMCKICTRHARRNRGRYRCRKIRHSNGGKTKSRRKLGKAASVPVAIKILFLQAGKAVRNAERMQEELIIEERFIFGINHLRKKLLLTKTNKCDKIRV